MISRRPLFIALSVLPLLFSSCGSSTPPAPAAWSDASCQFVPMKEEELQKLQLALTQCATLELKRETYAAEETHEWRRELKQGEELRHILSALAAVPHWYVADYGENIPLVSFVDKDYVRFLDAEGNVIYEPSLLLYDPCCVSLTGEKRYLSEFLPFPQF